MGPGSLYSSTKWAATAMAEAAQQELHGSGVRVTLMSPGVVEQLTAEDIARLVIFTIEQPPHVEVNEILVGPPCRSSRARRAANQEEMSGR